MNPSLSVRLNSNDACVDSQFATRITYSGFSEMRGPVMRITFVCNEYPPAPQGGIGTFTYHFARALVGAGHKITVVGLSDNDSERIDEGVRVVTLGGARGRGQFARRRALRDWLERDTIRNRTDIVELPEFEGMLPFRFDACPVVVRLHLSASTIAFHRFRLPSPSMYYCERKTLSLHRNWIAVSEHVLAMTRKTFILEPRRSKRIYNFAPPAGTIDPEEIATIRHRYGDFVLFVGKVNPRKGALVLARAAREFLRAHPDLQLVYLGADGSKWGLRFSKLARVLSGSDAAKRIHFIGTRPHSEAMTWMSAAKAVISPSRLESFGLTVVEAFQLGVPVVFSEWAPGPELIDDGRTGVLIDPTKPSEIAAAVDDLLARPEWSSRLVSEAKRSAEERFSLATCMKETLEFYAQLGERNRREGFVNR